jgi:hypothetical protein
MFLIYVVITAVVITAVAVTAAVASVTSRNNCCY